jgi:hypothetical protein
MPGYHRLYAGRLNLVLVVPKLAFRVTILNRDGMQRNVKLHLAVSRGNKQALSSEVVLGTVRAHQARTVTVRLPSGEVTFAQKNWLRVQVASDSSASSARGYGVIFGLG